MATTHEPLNLDERRFVQWKVVDMPTSFIWIIIFCSGPFQYGDGGICKLLRWMQYLNNATWDHNILHADRCLEDQRLLPESRNINMTGDSKLKIHFILWRELVNSCT
jgi:hypothetical protein